MVHRLRGLDGRGLLQRVIGGAVVAVPHPAALGVLLAGVPDLQRVIGVVRVGFRRGVVASSAEGEVTGGIEAAVVLQSSDSGVALRAGHIRALVPRGIHLDYIVLMRVVLFPQETVLAEIKVAFVAGKEHGGRVLVGTLSPAVAALPVDPDAVLNSGVHGLEGVVLLGV